MSIRFIYITLSQASVLIPAFAGAFYFNKLNKPFKILFLFFAISVLFEIQTNISTKLYHNNMPGLHLFTFIEMVIFSSVYYFHFSKNRIISFLILINTLIFAAAAIAGAFIINGIWSPNSISRTYSSVSLTCYALIYFYYLFVKDVQYYSWQYPMFWVSLGVLIYFGLNLFYFMLINYLTNYASFTGQISLFTHAIINIVANCLFAQSFKCHKNFITR